MKGRVGRVALALIGAIYCGTAAGQTRYILETKPAVDVPAIAAKYQLSIERSWRDERHVATAVQSLAPLAAGQLTSIRGENGVLEFEPNVGVKGSESEATSRAQVTLETLAAQLGILGTVDYYGNRVRAAYVNQFAAATIGLPDALQRFNGSNTTVAIIDTGVDPAHPALRDVLLPGYDFTRDIAGSANELADVDQSTVAILDGSRVAIPETKQLPVWLNQSTVAILDQSTVAILDASKLPTAFGHGTMVAGLIHLVAPRARILPLKAFRADGSANLSDIARAVYHAVNQGANVISMSFSMATPSPELAAAIAYATDKGVICVASAGNEGREKKVYPAALPKVFGVGSINFSDHRSRFSNYGGFVRTSAPGEAIITTFPGNNYAGVWGTSFSAAELAGAIALMRHADPNLSYDRAKDALNKGRKIGQEMGDARLFLSPTLSFCSSH